jgi:two-component system NtrC family sensor kinase
VTNERILVVDDEAKIVRLCVEVLTLHGYTAQGTTSGREAIARLEAEARLQGEGFHLLVVDIKMPDVDGLTVLRRGREMDPHLAAVVITGYGTLDSAIEALHAGAQRFVLKPFQSRDLLLSVEEALAQRWKEQERLRLRAQLPILEISQALMAGDDVEFLTGRLLGVVARQMGADRAVLLLPDKETGEWQIASLVGDGCDAPGKTPLRLWQDLLQEAGFPYGDEFSDAILASGGEAAVALRSGKRAVGLLGLGRSEGEFTPSDRDMLAIVAGQIATTLENADLYQQIRDSRDYFRTVLDSLHDEVMVLDRQYTITDVNATLLHNMGYEWDKVIGRPCYQISHQHDAPCDGPENPCPAAEVWRTGRPVQRLHVHHDRTGKTVYVDVAASPLRNEQGETIGVVEALRNVTAEWQLEASLATVRELGRELVLSRDEMEIARSVVSAADRILDFDRCDLWLVDEEEGVLRLCASTDASLAAGPPPLPMGGELGITVAVAGSGQAIYLPDTRQDPRYLSGGQDNRSELCVPLTVKDRVLGVLNAESPRPDAFEEADRRLFSTLADQAALAVENARLYQAVAQGEREWAETFDAITDAISIHDAEFRIVRANRTLAGWLGVPEKELVGKTCYTLFHYREQPPGFCPLAETIASGRPHTLEVEEPVMGGMFQVSTYPLTDDQGQVTGAVHILHDIAGRKQMEQQLIQSEKLAALGRLAASLAHEINNPLQALRSGLGLLLRGSYDKEKRQQYLQVANREVERLIAIAERMLNFYRPSAERRELTDVNAALDEVLALAGKKLQHSQVTLAQNLDRRLPPVRAVVDQLQQVFLNIVLNALEAMPEGGELTVASGFDRQRQQVWISCSDTGEGIAAEDLSRIFEPLYSTRPQGTGLGLAISYGIIEHHNGRIEVQSEVGVGSTFTVFLPIAGLDSMVGQEVSPIQIGRT